jgi:spore coat polysaccharide biosynthesis protein SpsF
LNTSKQKVVAITQARIGSTRLPSKVMKNICGKPILWHVWNRLLHAKEIDQIVIATTTLPEDDLIQSFCKETGIAFYRGSSDDVLSRYYETAKMHNAEIIIRITSDCPLIDPHVVDQIISAFKNENIDYMSNGMVRTFPRGLDTEVFTFNSLEMCYNQAIQQYEREHVTPYIYQNPEIFSTKNFLNSEDLSYYRWTVDTPEDFKLIQEIYNSLYEQKEIFLLEDILKLFAQRPELFQINKSIEQKKLSE